MNNLGFTGSRHGLTNIQEKNKLTKVMNNLGLTQYCNKSIEVNSIYRALGYIEGRRDKYFMTEIEVVYNLIFYNIAIYNLKYIPKNYFEFVMNFYDTKNKNYILKPNNKMSKDDINYKYRLDRIIKAVKHKTREYNNYK